MPSDTSKPSATESAKPLSTRKTRAEKPKADKVEKRRSAKPKSEQPTTKAKSGTKAVKPKSKSAKADKVSEGKKADKASEGKKAEKSRLSWKDMVKECIVAHSEEVRTGVSRTLIKKYISEKYSIEFTNANLALLNRAITTGAEDGIFVLRRAHPAKSSWPRNGNQQQSMRQVNVPAAEENAPAPPKKAPVKKAPAKPKTTTTKKTSSSKGTEKKKTAVKAAATKTKAKTASRPRSKKQVASTAPGSEPESEAAEE
ncbi:hypothetical protein A0H81_04493 [Grifola frondosa]|uniref:Histone H1 n=1 Tax=Grifola frondosa TaxID=5627 RepID=A0A1C7MFE0_GRIFR|nr:hypothetical protein A0H81_04493 [Grifola frondosa]